MCDIAIKKTEKTVVYGNDGNVIDEIEGFVLPPAKKYGESMPIKARHIRITEEIVNVMNITKNE